MILSPCRYSVPMDTGLIQPLQTNPPVPMMNRAIEPLAAVGLMQI